MRDWFRGPDRLPALAPDAMSQAQLDARTVLISGPRGRIEGPFQVLLRSPRLMEEVQKVGAFIRYQSGLTDDLRELAILVTSAHWRQPVEWAIHEPIARKAGISTEISEAVAIGRKPARLTHAQECVYDFCIEAHTTQAVSDTIYGRALELLGEEQVVELAALCGYYAMLALIMNVARTTPPDEL